MNPKLLIKYYLIFLISYVREVSLYIPVVDPVLKKEDWLRRFDSLAETHIDETPQSEGITVLNLHTDQSVIVGLVCMLHGLGITILQLRVIPH